VVDTYYRDGRRFEESSGSEKKGTAIALLRIREGDGAHGFTRDAKNGAHSTHRDQSVHAIVITGTTAS
jgi:hypothetical protein